jgi:hypothetical protein
MNYAIVRSNDFDKKVKVLSKKYRSLADDLEVLAKELLANPTMVDDLGNNIRKVRMAIKSKNKGKSGGARIITCTVLVSIDSSDIYLLTIYDKGKQANISPQEIEELKRESNLL